jgi:hypothetical protein
MFALSWRDITTLTALLDRELNRASWIIVNRVEKWMKIIVSTFEGMFTMIINRFDFMDDCFLKNSNPKSENHVTIKNLSNAPLGQETPWATFVGSHLLARLST